MQPLAFLGQEITAAGKQLDSAAVAEVKHDDFLFAFTPAADFLHAECAVHFSRLCKICNLQTDVVEAHATDDIVSHMLLPRICNYLEL